MLLKSLEVLDAAYLANGESFTLDLIAAIATMEGMSSIPVDVSTSSMDAIVQRLLNLSAYLSDDEIATSLVAGETRCLVSDEHTSSAAIVELIRPICGLAEAQLQRCVTRFVDPTGLIGTTALASLLLELKRKTAYSNPGMLRAIFDECKRRRQEVRILAQQRLIALSVHNCELATARQAYFAERMSQLAAIEETMLSERRQELKNFFSRRVRLQDPLEKSEPISGFPPPSVAFIINQLLLPNLRSDPHC